MLKDIIDKAKVGEELDISAYTIYASVCFSYNERDGYSYRLVSRRHVRMVYPEKNSREIRMWRTLNGAKRYFLKRHDRGIT